MALPNDKISIPMVARELGTTENDLGRLCTHGNINKWSKWKPIRNNKIANLAPSDLSPDFGLLKKEYPTVSSLVDGIYNETDKPVWEYLKPRGGATEPYRLDDFRSYLHNAVIPFMGFNVTPKVSKLSGNPIVLGTMGFARSTPTQIGLEDFDFENRRLAMAYRKGTTGALETVIAPVGSFEVELNVNSPSLPIGNYQSFLFMTNNAGGIAGELIGFEGHPKVLTFEIISTAFTMTIKAMFSKIDSDDVVIEVKANNATGAAQSLPLCTLQIRNQMNPCSSTIQQNEEFIAIGTLTAPEGNNIIYSDTISINRSFYSSWKVCWSNAGAYPNEFSANIIQEM